MHTRASLAAHVFELFSLGVYSRGRLLGLIAAHWSNGANSEFNGSANSIDAFHSHG